MPSKTASATDWKSRKASFSCSAKHPTCSSGTEKLLASRETRRFAELVVAKTIHDAIHTADKPWHIETDQQAEANLAKSEVREELLFVDWYHIRLGSVVDDHLFFDDQVEPKRRGQQHLPSLIGTRCWRSQLGPAIESS